MFRFHPSTCLYFVVSIHQPTTLFFSFSISRIVFFFFEFWVGPVLSATVFGCRGRLNSLTRPRGPSMSASNQPTMNSAGFLFFFPFCRHRRWSHGPSVAERVRVFHAERVRGTPSARSENGSICCW